MGKISLLKSKLRSNLVKFKITFLTFWRKSRLLLMPKLQLLPPLSRLFWRRLMPLSRLSLQRQMLETGKGLLAELLETIIAKIGELKDNIAGYNIFDDLLSDVLKPALKKAVENLIPTIAKHLGDLAGKITV